MNDVLLFRCSSSIEAVNITNILEVNEIAFRQHDETMDQRVGAYGPNPGIAIYVAEPLIILSILLFLAPCLYIFHTPGWGTSHYIATAIFLLNILLMFLINRLTKNCRCSKCGKRLRSVQL